MKWNEYQLSYHTSGCFIITADLLIFNFFKWTDKIPNICKYVVKTKSVRIIISEHVGFDPGFPVMPEH